VLWSELLARCSFKRIVQQHLTEWMEKSLLLSL
jgi:hypothetical protein